MSRILQAGQLELSRMELPTLDKAQNMTTEATRYIIPELYRPLVLQPNCKMRPCMGREVPIPRLGLAEKSSPYWILKYHLAFLPSGPF